MNHVETNLSFSDALEAILCGGRMYAEEESMRNAFFFVWAMPNGGGLQTAQFGFLQSINIQPNTKNVINAELLVRVTKRDDWVVERDWTAKDGVEINFNNRN